MAKLPQGRGPRYGPDNFTDQNESWAQRLATKPQQDGMWLSPVGETPLCQARVFTANTPYIFFVPTRFKEVTVTQVSLTAVSFAAPYTSTVALYEYLADTQQFVQLTNTLVTFSITADGNYRVNLPAPVTINTKQIIFLGLVSTLNHQGPASGGQMSGVGFGRVLLGTTLPTTAAKNTTTRYANGSPAIYYLSQTAVDLFT